MRIAIVGAGVAGLAAARFLTREGLGVIVLEAAERTGGRAHTVTAAHGLLPVELGPEYVHGESTRLDELLRLAGLELDDVVEHHHARRAGELQDLNDVWAKLALLLDDASPRARHDESAHAFMARRQMARDDAELFARLVEGFYAADLEDISIASVARDSGSGSGSPAKGRLRRGWGTLASWLETEARSRGAEIRLRTQVASIEWNDAGARVALASGENIAADAVIVTVSIGVLRAGTIAFSPMLPPSHRDAIAGIAMGQVVKLVICTHAPIWREVEPALSFLHASPASSFPTFWVRSVDHSHQLTAWAGGRHARPLAGRSVDELAALALLDAAAALGLTRQRLEREVIHVHYRDYAADPWIRGAYSYPRVGGVDAPEALSQPVGPALYFAGEATDVEAEGTITGALESGVRAAKQVLRARAR